MCIRDRIGFAHHAVVKRIKMIKKEKIKLLPSMAILSLSLIFFIAVSCTDSSDTLDEAMSSDESTFTILTERGSSYIYPVALLELFKSGKLTTGRIPEYRPPWKELFEKFKEDRNFRVYVDGNEFVGEKRASLSRDLIKCFVVDYSPDVEWKLHKANLYTHSGYLKMAEKAIWKYKTSIGVTEEDGLLLLPDFVKMEGVIAHILLPPKIKRPNSNLIRDVLSNEETTVMLDGHVVYDKAVLSQNHMDYFYFTESEKDDYSTVMLFTEEGYLKLVEMNKSLTPDLNIQLN